MAGDFLSTPQCPLFPLCVPLAPTLPLRCWCCRLISRDFFTVDAGGITGPSERDFDVFGPEARKVTFSMRSPRFSSFWS